MDTMPQVVWGLVVSLVMLYLMDQYENKHEPWYAIAYWVGLFGMTAVLMGTSGMHDASMGVAVFGLLGAVGHAAERKKRPRR